MMLYCAVGPVYKIRFKFRQIRIPPGFDVNHLGMQILSNTCSQLCAYLSMVHNVRIAADFQFVLIILSGCVGGCDDVLKQLIDICGTGSRSQG